MYVTATKNLTRDEILDLTDEELKTIAMERMEWLIHPMELLSKEEHTGWAILALFRTFVEETRLYEFSVGFDMPTVVVDCLMDTSGDLLLDPIFSLTGEQTEAFLHEVDPEANRVKHISVNPHKLPGLARQAMKEFEPMELWEPEYLKSVLLQKIEEMEERRG